MGVSGVDDKAVIFQVLGIEATAADLLPVSLATSVQAAVHRCPQGVRMTGRMKLAHTHTKNIL